MRKRSSMNGTTSATVVNLRPTLHSTDVDTSKNETPFGHWNAHSAKNLVAQPTAYEIWLVSQAQSLMKRSCTVAEAKELFERIDIVTRKPREPDAPTPRRFARALKALRTVFGTILLGMGLAGCVEVPRTYLTCRYIDRVTYDSQGYWQYSGDRYYDRINHRSYRPSNLERCTVEAR